MPRSASRCEDRRCCPRRDLLDGPGDIGGRNGLAVLEHHARAEAEHPGIVLGIMLPAFRQLAAHLALQVVAEQAAIAHQHRRLRRRTNADPGMQIGRVGREPVDATGPERAPHGPGRAGRAEPRCPRSGRGGKVLGRAHAWKASPGCRRERLPASSLLCIPRRSHLRPVHRPRRSPSTALCATDGFARLAYSTSSPTPIVRTVSGAPTRK